MGICCGSWGSWGNSSQKIEAKLRHASRAYRRPASSKTPTSLPEAFLASQAATDCVPLPGVARKSGREKAAKSKWMSYKPARSPPQAIEAKLVVDGKPSGPRPLLKIPVISANYSNPGVSAA
jgi:hypothetical protein